MKIICFLNMLLGFLPVFAQVNTNEVLTAGGDYFKGSEITLEWTLGENSIETYSSGEIIFTQGFNQSLYTITSLNKNSENPVTVKLYPNPATRYIILEIKDDSNFKESWNYTLSNIQGQQIIKSQIKKKITQIDISALEDEIYLFKLYNEKKELIQTYKLVKQ